MSHEIKDGVDMLSGTELQWHRKNEVHPVIGLRDSVSNPLARWDVKETKLLLPNGRDTGFRLLETTDGHPVGVPFGDSYKVFTNEAFLSLTEALCAELDRAGVKWTIKSSGSVRGRALTFLSIEIDSASKYVVDGREFQNFLSLLNSFDKSCRVTIKDSSICVVCSNTFHATLSDDSGAMAVAVTHKKNMANALGDVPKMLQAAISGREAMLRRLKHWAAFPVKLSEAEGIFAAFLHNGKGDGADMSTRAANIIERLACLFAKGKGNKGETALDLFQAATEYYTHESAGGSNQWKQFVSSEYGSGATNKQEFWEIITKAETLKQTIKAGKSAGY